MIRVHIPQGTVVSCAWIALTNIVADREVAEIQFGRMAVPIPRRIRSSTTLLLRFIGEVGFELYTRGPQMSTV